MFCAGIENNFPTFFSSCAQYTAGTLIRYSSPLRLTIMYNIISLQILQLLNTSSQLLLHVSAQDKFNRHRSSQIILILSRSKHTIIFLFFSTLQKKVLFKTELSRICNLNMYALCTLRCQENRKKFYIFGWAE